MKIQILSDLHLEFLSPRQTQALLSQVQPRGDVLVLAGDIGDMGDSHQAFLRSMSALFPKVFVVAGNHEYYGSDMTGRDQQLGTFCSDLGNVSFLGSRTEDYGGFRWVGTTLWSHVDPGNHRTINDTRLIKGMTIPRYNQLHQEAVAFLAQALTDPHPTIVITHHLPSMELVHPRYQTAEHLPYNQWFASSSLDRVLENATHHVPLWIYGHTHTFSDRVLHQTRMVCNPYGYEQENDHPDLNYVVSLR
jgi:predicted phosphodiesterase